MKALFKAILAASLYAILSHAAVAQTTMATDDMVYQNFGGKAGISKVVDDFLMIWRADPRISERLVDADVERLGSLLKEQITQLTGGPAVYSGKDMATAHAKMGLHNADFNALAEDLQLSMEKNQVPSRDQNKLLAKLAPMQKQIVTK